MAKWEDIEHIRMAGKVLVHEENYSGDKLYSKDMEHDFPNHKPGGVNNQLQRLSYARDRSVPESYTDANKRQIDRLTDTLIAVGVDMKKTPLTIRSGREYGNSRKKTPGSHISSRPGGYRFGENKIAPIFISLTPKQKLAEILASPNKKRIYPNSRIVKLRNIQKDWVEAKGLDPVGGHILMINEIHDVVIFNKRDLHRERQGY